MKKTLQELKANDVWAITHQQDQYVLKPTRLKADHWLCLHYHALNLTAEVIVEMDGVQHFEPVAFFGGEERLEKQRVQDQRKEEWCREHNVHLLRIDDSVKPEDYAFTVRDFVERVAQQRPAATLIWRVGQRYHPTVADLVDESVVLE